MMQMYEVLVKFPPPISTGGGWGTLAEWEIDYADMLSTFFRVQDWSANKFHTWRPLSACRFMLHRIENGGGKWVPFFFIYWELSRCSTGDESLSSNLVIIPESAWKRRCFVRCWINVQFNQDKRGIGFLDWNKRKLVFWFDGIIRGVHVFSP